MDITRYFKKPRLEVVATKQNVQTLSSDNKAVGHNSSKLDSSTKDISSPVNQRAEGNGSTTSVSEVQAVAITSQRNIAPENEILSHNQRTLLIPDTNDSAEFDIGRYVNAELNDHIREQLLRNCWVPPDSFKFPTKNFGKKNLKFQLSWMKQFTWLSYSKYLHGAFCKSCVVFSQETCGKGNHQRFGALVKTPYTKWKNAKDDFANHANSCYHKKACEFASNFLRVLEGKQQCIENQLIAEKKAQDAEKMKILLSITKTIILCGQQEIALRGTCDSGNIFRENNFNDGNFRSLLRFRVDAGDGILKKHLECGPRNAQYTSPTIQNELIDLCGKHIQKQLVEKINTARGFSILCDESTDISGVEQVSLCARYVDKQEQRLREDFLIFVPATDVTGRGLSSLILEKLKFLGINCDFLVGQGYDGAAAMSGYLHGAQAYIKNEYPMALYVHCGAHSLNLALGDSCTISSIRNCIGTIKSVGTLFRTSAKNNKILKDSIKELFPDSGHMTLVSMCETRWIQKHEAILRFKEIYAAIVLSLQNLQDSKNRELSQKAHQLLCAVIQEQFVISLCTLDAIFSLTLPLSKTLQNVDCDLTTALKHVDLLLNTLHQFRINALEQFGIIFKRASELISEVGGVLTMPRVTSKMTQRGNIPSNSPEEYLKKNLFLPFVDHVRTQLNDRFLSHRSLITSLQIFIPHYIKLNVEKELEICKEFYKHILPESGTLAAEYSVWQNKWKDIPNASRPGNPMEALFLCNPNFFPNIHVLLQILATIPVSTATPERTFSTLRRLKTYLRNSTCESRLTGLALLAIHRNINVKPEEIVEIFCKSSRRAFL